MFNYIQCLKADNGEQGIIQLRLKYELGTIAAPTNEPYIGIPAGPDTTRYFWLDAEYTGQGLGRISEGDTLTVTGHSLGGHLAALALRLFPNLFDEAYTFNAPGFDPATSMGLTDEFLNLFAKYLNTPPLSNFVDTDKIHTLESEDSDPGDDTSFVSSIVTGTPASEEVYITTEKNSHSMDQFMDGLAVHTLIEKLSLGESLEYVQTLSAKLFLAAAPDKGKRDEALIEGLSRIILNDASEVIQGEVESIFSPAGWDSRISLHERILRLETYVTDHPNLKLTGLVDLSAAGIADMAKAPDSQGLATRYALLELVPFIITGDDSLYVPHNTDGRLDINNFSDQYLIDRAMFLFHYLHQGTIAASGGRIDFRDLATGKSGLAIGSGLEGKYIFGSDAGERINGDTSPDSYDSGNDHLYGMVGDDIISGGFYGEDYLDGGKGKDKLYGNAGEDILIGGDDNDTLIGGADADLMIGGEGMDIYDIEGHDTIRDTGRNFIVYDGQLIGGSFIREGDTSTYRFLGDDSLTLTFNSPGRLVLSGTDSVTFENQTSAAAFANVGADGEQMGTPLIF